MLPYMIPYHATCKSLESHKIWKKDRERPLRLDLSVIFTLIRKVVKMQLTLAFLFIEYSKRNCLYGFEVDKLLKSGYRKLSKAELLTLAINCLNAFVGIVRFLFLWMNCYKIINFDEFINAGRKIWNSCEAIQNDNTNKARKQWFSITHRDHKSYR